MQYLAQMETAHFKEFLRNKYPERNEDTEEFHVFLDKIEKEYGDYMEKASLNIPERIMCTSDEFFSSMEKYLSAINELARIDSEIRFVKDERQFVLERLAQAFNEKEQELDICQFKECPVQLPKIIRCVEAPDILHRMLREGVFDAIKDTIDFNAEYNSPDFKRVTIALNETVKAYAEYQLALSGLKRDTLDIPAFMYESILYKKLDTLKDALTGEEQYVKERTVPISKENLITFPDSGKKNGLEGENGLNPEETVTNNIEPDYEVDF